MLKQNSVSSVNTELEIKQMLARLTGYELNEISIDADLVNDLGIDSLKVIEIATEIEKKFKVVVKDSQMAKLRKVSEAANLLKELLEKKNAQNG
ncbi:MAG: acyl carrier protein [Candidatus Omnitrophica bacterium]|nr:acyl carrier protein [Candidatus Omnitrophota bacterium]